MTRWVVCFDDKPEMLKIRADKEKRDAHVAYVKAHPEILIGGGLKPDVTSDFCGALWVVETQTRMEVANLVLNDPFYVKEFRSFKIFTWGKILEDQTVEL